MKTETKRSLRMLSFALAMLMLLSSVPTGTVAAEWESSDLVITNPGNDNEYAVNAAGSSKTDTIALTAGTHTIEQKAEDKTVYYSYTATSKGTVTINISTSENSFTIMYYPDGADGSSSSLNLGVQPDPTLVEVGDTVVFGVKICTSKWGGYLDGTLTVKIELESEGGETPNPECKHTNVGNWIFDETNHWKVCADCGEKTNVAAHSFGEWANGKQTCECGKEIICEHSYTNACDADCNTCGATRAVEDHQYDNACDTDCNICGATREVGDHSYVDGKCTECGAKDPTACDHIVGAYEQTKAPTCTEIGRETAKCTKCFEERKSRYVMPLGHNFVDGVCTDCDATEASVGTEANPAPFVIGDNTGVVPNKAYYFFTFNAVMDGTVSMFSEGTAWRAYVYINDKDVTYDRFKANSYIPADKGSTMTLDVKAGEELVLKITTPYVSYSNYGGGEITVNFQFTTKCEHSFVTDGSKATCTEAGSVGYTCAECIISYAVYSRPLGHTWVNATCTTPKTCSVCKDTEGDALGHTEVTVPGYAASCKATGLTDGKKCTVCGVTTLEQTEIPLADHTPGEPAVENGQAPTCTVGGTYEKVVYCDICEAELSRETVTEAAKGHTWVNATCTTPKTCSVCKDTEGNALGHTEVTDEAVAPTCTETGLTEGKHCSVCSTVLVKQETVAATGHTEVTDKAVAPTCTETGLTEGSHCSVCKTVLVKQKTVDALGHSYGSWVEGKKTCSTCGDVLNCQHRGGYATCIRLAVCSECNMSYGPYGDHTPKTSEGKDPTCTEPGLTDGSYCSRYGCGKVLVEQEEIPATGEHIYENGKCTMCGGDRTVLECEHQWSDATCTAPKTCPKCGSTEGNALGHNYVNDECTKCGDTGIAIPEDGKLVSGQLYVYTATEAVHLTIELSGMKDSSGKNIYSMDDKTVMVQINGALEATRKIDSYLAEGQSVKLMLVAMNDKTYTATAELTEKALSFLTLGENTIKPETEYIYIAEKTGTVYLTVVDGTVKVNGEEPSEQYSVEAGEMITVTNKGDVDAHITLRFEGKDEHAPGSEKNPLALPFANCPANTAEIAAGGTLYYQLSDFKNGYVLKVTGENAYIMVNDTRYNAENGVVTLKVSGNHLIQIGNAGTETATFAMETYIPVGHSENPDTLTSGQHTVDLPASSTYYYAFTATEDIETTIRVSGGDYWRFFISHIDATGNKITEREDHRGDRGDKDTVELVLAADETIILELTTYSGGVIGGTVTADVTIRSTAVAQINGVKYKTLADAIEAATNGDTIILLSDLDLNHEDAQNFQPEEKNGYQVMFVVADKNITIDLNGNTIFVDATTGFGEGTILAFPENDVGMIDWKADRLQGMLMAVIAVHNNGHLTLKDSVGTGGIKTEAWNGDKDNTVCGIVYSVLTNYSTDSSITIEGGRYEADFTRDCLVYTYASANEGQGNVGVVVSGGTFILGNAGQGRNYSTWIFNAKGQNERHVWVTGGTFSTDIRHQYWVFEAQIDKECALVKQGDFYTIVPAVAYVTEREWSSAWYTYETGYATLEEAIAACEGPKTKTYYSKEYVSEQEIVVLLQNITLSNEIVIPEDKTVAIDRNGYEITGTITGNVIYYNKGEPINQEENEGENTESET